MGLAAGWSSPNRVSTVRHSVTVTEPLPPLPRLPLLSLADLAACARFIHEDRCSWMGDNTHPCRCGVPRTLRKLAAIYGDLLVDGE